MMLERGGDRLPGIDHIDRSRHADIDIMSIHRCASAIDTVLIAMWRVDKGLLSGYGLSATLFGGEAARMDRGIARVWRWIWIDLARI
jgi:hypothetical protein